MNINTGFNPYNSGMIANAADRTKMASSQSLTGSPTDTLKEGEVFEGSVNSIENGKVVIGLANGQTMNARLDPGVSLVPGQSVFFEVKSNDGNLVQIRPVNLNGLDANPTLLKALSFANITASERTINMVNSMMQNSMSINPENLTAMNRVVLSNPEVDVPTLVTMSKYGLEITPENIQMFQNYANDKAALNDNFQIISDMLPKLMESEELSTTDVINLNSQLKTIFVDGLDNEAGAQGLVNEAETLDGTVTSKDIVPTANQQNTDVTIAKPDVLEAFETEPGKNIIGEASEKTVINTQQMSQMSEEALGIETASTEAAAKPAGALQNQQEMENAIRQQSGSDVGTQALNSFASEKQISSFNTLLNSLPDFPKDNLEVFGENGTLKADANIKEVFREITNYFENHPDIPKETLNDIIKTPLYKGLLKNLIADSFSMEPKNVTKPGEISKLYERVLKQSDALEKLVSAFNNKAAETIKNQTAEIKQNVNFMNSANEMYNFVQIPLKMYNQNTDGMLYVRQNKRSSYEEGEEITAFLHFDMEYLGPTDVFISLKEVKVGCKWNLANESSLQLIEDNIDILTERLAAKGFTVTSEMTCGAPRASFVEDFLEAPPINTETTSDGLVHRYSFDMRA
ncbi:flagellar hook-length control protein FliK [Pseudobutyrivibrio xylanivorans]|uniref:Flagellar hook-length control protein FliK n=1 Tax=Pseudobutyrivibrio xylanivorans TaxID=185007 RepID=A0A5P6VS76_PSEXY|nr:flagellar hook-length control protein FliK [Pseudobutyrivibrio xylanivorans]QFJ55555.1 flagellar hook-length control protein FliK [Pseudobutyrivibrio xylanivorans]